MNAPVKYLFEDDFAAAKPASLTPVVALATHEAELARTLPKLGEGHSVELERLSVLAVRRTEAILVLVRTVE